MLDNIVWRKCDKELNDFCITVVYSCCEGATNSAMKNVRKNKRAGGEGDTNLLVKAKPVQGKVKYPMGLWWWLALKPSVVTIRVTGRTVLHV